MKHLITRTLTSLMLAAMWLPLAAQAQQTSVVKTNIPFEFSFNGRTFPAGEYSLVRPLDHMLTLRDSRGHTIAQSFTIGVDSLSAADATKLKFYNFEGRYILSEVWEKYDSSGVQLSRSNRAPSVIAHRSTDSRAAAEGSQP